VLNVRVTVSSVLHHTFAVLILLLAFSVVTVIIIIITAFV